MDACQSAGFSWSGFEATRALLNAVVVLQVGHMVVDPIQRHVHRRLVRQRVKIHQGLEARRAGGPGLCRTLQLRSFGVGVAFFEGTFFGSFEARSQEHISGVLIILRLALVDLNSPPKVQAMKEKTARPTHPFVPFLFPHFAAVRWYIPLLGEGYEHQPAFWVHLPKYD